MTPIEPGAVLAGRFELLRFLGAGALAEVFAARDVITGEEVALKVLHAHAAEDRQLVERFRRELRLARGLDHPGIVRVHELHQHQGRPFIGMELLRGETLAERLERGRIPPAEARRVLRAALEAVRAAHAAGVVHRDLKPQNVFLCGDGSVKLLDFGLARAAGSSRLTAASVVLGTPGYLAPELLSGGGGDPRADLYSLGALAFELFTGRRAFDGADPFAVLRQQREGARSPRAADPAVPEADDALLRRALDPDPEKRFVDAGQMLRALDGAAVPEAPPVPPALVEGEWMVRVEAPKRVRWAGFEDGRPLRRLAALFGVRPPPALWIAPAYCQIAASGVDRPSAEALARLCEEAGMTAAVQPVPRRSRALRFAARQERWLSPLLGLACTIPFAVQLAGGHNPWSAGRAIGPALILAYLSLGWPLVLRVLYNVRGVTRPLVPASAAGDPAVIRLAQGVVRRAERLRQRHARAPAALQAAAAPLLEAAAEAERAAADLVARLRAGGADEAARDRLTERILTIGAVLDEALEEQRPDAAGSGAIRRLQAEAATARELVAALAAGGEGPAAAADPGSLRPGSLPAAGRERG